MNFAFPWNKNHIVIILYCNALKRCLCWINTGKWSGSVLSWKTRLIITVDAAQGTF